MTGLYVAAALQNGPDTVDANLCILARRFFAGVPDHCIPSIDVWGTTAAIILICLCVFFLICDGILWHRGKKRTNPGRVGGEIIKDDPMSEHRPDVRVADSPNALMLFEGKEGDTLLPLLEAEKIIAWARRMGGRPGDHPAPIKVRGAVWRDHIIEFHPRGEGPGRINQTFIKTRARNESVFYDVFLNAHQLKRVWPDLDLTQQPEPMQWTPLLEVRQWALQAGWNMDQHGSAGHNDSLDLMQRLRQAAVDNKVTFRGRRYRDYDWPETKEPLIDVAPSHFVDFELDALDFIGARNNYGIFTGKTGKSKNQLRGQIFRDLHVNTPQVISWLASNRKLPPAQQAKQQATPTRHRSIPITPDSMYSFLNGYPIVRETDQAIASDLGLQVEEDHFPADALANAVQHFGIASLADLEKLLREDQELVIELSRYFRPKGTDGAPAKLTRGHSVHMFLEMLAARTGSIDRYMDYANTIGAACGTGFAQNVIDAYRQIAPPADGINESGQPTKPQLSRPNIRYEFEATLPQLEGAPLAWTKTPHLRWLPRADGGRDIISVFIEGKNVEEKELKLESAYIISGITGTRLEMKIEVVDGRNVHRVSVTNAGPIPPQAKIKMLSAELNGDEGVEESQFAKYWGTLSFVVEFDGKEHRRIYDRKAIDAALAEEEIDPPEPHVTLRKL